MRVHGHPGDRAWRETITLHGWRGNGIFDFHGRALHGFQACGRRNVKSSAFTRDTLTRDALSLSLRMAITMMVMTMMSQLLLIYLLTFELTYHSSLTYSLTN